MAKLKIYGLDVIGDHDVFGNQMVNGHVFVAGEQAVAISQTIGGDQTVDGAQTVGGNQTVSGDQMVTGVFRNRRFPTVRLLKTANYQAKAGEYIDFTTSGGEFTITLPPNPVDEDVVGFHDLGGVCSVPGQNLIIEPGTKNLMGDAGPVKVDINLISFWLEFRASTNDWRMK